MSEGFQSRARLAGRRRLWRGAARSGDAGPVDPGNHAPVDVAIVCESTYPYLTGGLSAVVHQICEANPALQIGIIHIAWDRESPAVPLYDVPPQVRWVKTVYQSLHEHAATFQRFTPRDTGLSAGETTRLARRVIAAVAAHIEGDDTELWRLYDEGINPLTRTYRLWPVISTRELMRSATEFFAASGLSFTDLFWHLREFFSLAYAVTDLVLPRAEIYHAHTTGAAAVLAACAARQHGTHFLLTEHNLYTRDTINHLLERSMATAVPLEEWRTLEEYQTSTAPPRPARVTPSQRAWMAWWVRTGVFAYRAATRITYLYPDAIDEAMDLGGMPEKSVVLPNGVTPAHFDDARSQFRSRLRRASAQPSEDRIWKLAYAARVVPIKGLLDLLEALALLVERGFTSWELDAMGPDGEMPYYVEQCRARCTELGLDGHVRFMGSVNLRERFGEYDTLILPSFNEGQPIVVLEAMTMGLPTLGTYVGGMRQLVEDVLHIAQPDGSVLEVGPCGALVEPHDIEGLAQMIEELIGPDSRFEEFSRNAEARVQHYFHIETAMRMYRELYSDLLGTTPPLSDRSAAASGSQSLTGTVPSQLTPSDQVVEDASRIA